MEWSGKEVFFFFFFFFFDLILFFCVHFAYKIDHSKGLHFFIVLYGNGIQNGFFFFFEVQTQAKKGNRPPNGTKKD